jgi:hypothetical protein
MMMTTTIILCGIVVLIMIGLLALVFMKSKQVNLTGKTEEKPEWMQSTPPQETMDATRAENEGVTLFNYDEGEKMAAPFAEQIEDIMRAILKNDSSNQYDVDLGTADDGSIEFWVNGTKYVSAEDLPDVKLKEAFKEAVKKWNEK